MDVIPKCGNYRLLSFYVRFSYQKLRMFFICFVTNLEARVRNSIRVGVKVHDVGSLGIVHHVHCWFNLWICYKNRIGKQ